MAGSSLWRTYLAGEILKLVENTTPTEVMMRLQKTIMSLDRGLVLAGEGQ
jgi:hypothetical protein